MLPQRRWLLSRLSINLRLAQPPNYHSELSRNLPAQRSDSRYQRSPTHHTASRIQRGRDVSRARHDDVGKRRKRQSALDTPLSSLTHWCYDHDSSSDPRPHLRRQRRPRQKSPPPRALPVQAAELDLGKSQLRVMDGGVMEPQLRTIRNAAGAGSRVSRAPGTLVWRVSSTTTIRSASRK